MWFLPFHYFVGCLVFVLESGIQGLIISECSPLVHPHFLQLYHVIPAYFSLMQASRKCRSDNGNRCRLR